ncbi:hydroxymethylglutaryl-CoA synthase [Lactobacillus sp. ESL0791]|uniref:hydroxymethylglutaryl-CoA synthase n=1 Tax=Lactobacillus sp. ESL0791 TaxID=2983234 RepID=UPI0023F7C078|nr:hydroxymethylglutaryl-CoA synthase [Lactobacillus sp. ESL0791]MDF7638530.1 hydroxymethylglutaryl-CoA synthase [Lactobacillus sp. ESL0791]
MQIGIDRIGMYTPNKYIDLVDLAHARNEDPAKFLIGIGQKEMSVADETQDAVSMGINATLRYFDRIDSAKVGLLLLATESGVDQSKSGSLFINSALGLGPDVRTFEIKEACFGLTAALVTARDYIQAHPDKTAIVIGSDIARYGLKTAGEVTQGAGSISLLVKKDPGILALDPQSSACSADINDFWRPNESKLALVDGKFSTAIYLDFFKTTFTAYQKMTGLKTNDFAALIYHLPFSKMGLKANRIAVAGQDEVTTKRLNNSFTASIQLGQRIGNTYTAALYFSLLSLLENGALAPSARIGLFSYGSGAMGEFLSGKVIIGHQNMLMRGSDEQQLQKRRKLTIAEYEEVFTQALTEPQDDVELTSDAEKGTWYFAGISERQRQYRKK